MLRRLTHSCFGSRDLDRTQWFYCEVLGCMPVHEFRNDAGERYGFFLSVGDGTFLEFFKESDQPAGNATAFRHICFEVEDISLLVERLHKHGYACEVRRGRTDKALQCFVEDPNGVAVEFHQYDSQAVLFKYLPESSRRPSSNGGFLSSASVVRDDSGRSLAYFCKGPTIKVDQDIIDELIRESERNDFCNVRICLHESPEALFQEMVILERLGFFFPPHKHRTKGESCHIIEGRLGFFVFDDTGAVQEASIVGEGYDLLFRVEKDTWHTVVPLSNHVIYHEAKPGPFLGSEDSVFPPWAPERSDADGIKSYSEHLLSQLPT